MISAIKFKTLKNAKWLGYLHFKRLSGENLSPLKVHAPIYGTCTLSGQIFLPKIFKISPLKVHLTCPKKYFKRWHQKIHSCRLKKINFQWYDFLNNKLINTMGFFCKALIRECGIRFFLVKLTKIPPFF